MQQQRDHRRPGELAEAPDRGQQAHEARGQCRPQAPYLLHRKKGDRGERYAEQQAAEREAREARAPDADRDAQRLHQVAADQQGAHVQRHAQPGREQCAEHHSEAEDGPEHVQPR